jgi:hypothetical protein
MQNRGNMTVFVHPNTGAELSDHKVWALWYFIFFISTILSVSLLEAHSESVHKYGMSQFMGIVQMVFFF